MKIALCTEILYPIYGVEKRVYEMAKRLGKHGFDVTVYTSSAQKDVPDIKIKQVSNPTIIHPPKRNYFNCINFTRKLIQVLLKDKYDIIDANGHLSLIPCYIASRLKGKPIVATIHDLYLNEWKTMYSGKAAIFGPPFELSFSKLNYDEIITLNTTIKNKMIDLMKMKKDKIDIIPSGIDLNYLDKIT
ncbi:glycosyltransferase family 4 protein, partial [Candidatus Aenigmatarchaeota archaeon]